MSAPAKITSIQQIFELFNTEFSWGISSDKSDARMTVTAQTSALDEEGFPGTNDGDALAFGYANSLAQYVTLDNVEDMIQLILPLVGINNKDGSGYQQLSRNVPMLFPYLGGPIPVSGKYYYTHALLAHSISVLPIGSANSTSFRYGDPAKSGAQLVPWNDFDGSTELAPGYLRYKNYAFNVDFSVVDYIVVSDSDPTLGPINVDSRPWGGPGLSRIWMEWNRNTRIRFNPYLDVIQLEGGQLQFVENPNPNPPLPPLMAPGAPAQDYLKSPAIPVPRLLYERKGVITVEWFNVPASFVLTPSTSPNDPGQPRMFNRALGCVNAATWLGCPPETLLLRDAPEFRSKPYGSAKRDVISNYDFAYPWLYDITMKFILFNPPTGVAVNPPHRGHNVFAPKGQMFYLFANRVPGNQDPNNPANINAANPPLFPLFDFRFLFSKADTF